MIQKDKLRESFLALVSIKSTADNIIDYCSKYQVPIREHYITACKGTILINAMNFKFNTIIIDEMNLKYVLKEIVKEKKYFNKYKELYNLKETNNEQYTNINAE